jgi:hypothetical protein
MVEYETLGLVFAVVGLVSFQIKLVNDRLKEEITNAKTQHDELKDKIIEHKCNCEICKTGKCQCKRCQDGVF